MLELCRAIVVAPTPFDSHALAEVAEELGFGDVVSIFNDTDPSNGLRYPVSFFLVHHRLSDVDCEDILDAVRNIDRPNLRYSPMVVLLPETSAETVRKFVGMGFDDVISLPQSHVQLTARLGAQLDRDIVYLETTDYLGPDRRRMDAYGSTHRSKGISPHTRVVLRRDPEQGTFILSRQLRSQQNFQVARVAPARHGSARSTSAAQAPVFGRRAQSPGDAQTTHRGG